MEFWPEVVKLLPFLGSGAGGVMLIIWFLSERTNRATLAANNATMLTYREDTRLQALAHEKALAEVRQMYRDNVELVRSYQKIAEGLQDLIIMNTQTIATLCVKVDENQYCPMVRPKK